MRNRNIESVTPVYTLSTTSTLSGIPVHSIRQYMDRGLILPYKKESKRNLFSQVDIIRLKYIHKLLVDRRIKYCRDQINTSPYSMLGNQELP